MDDFCSDLVDTGDGDLDGVGGWGLNNLDGSSGLAICDLLEMGDVDLVGSVVRHFVDVVGGRDGHGNIFAQLFQSFMSGSEDLDLGRLTSPEENDPLSGLNKLVSEDGTTKGVIHSTFQLVHIDEEAVDLDVPGATAVDNDAAIMGDLADVFCVEEYVVASPGTEHTPGSLNIANVASGRGVCDDADDTGSTGSLGDDVHVVVEDNEILTTLSSIEVDKLGNWLPRTDKHLADTGESDFRAGVIASEGGIGEDPLGQLEILDTEGLSADDHPVETIERVPGTEFDLDVVDKDAEDGGSEVGSEELSVCLVLELTAEGGTLIGDRGGLIQIESGLVEHKTADLEQWAEESLKDKI